MTSVNLNPVDTPLAEQPLQPAEPQAEQLQQPADHEQRITLLQNELALLKAQNQQLLQAISSGRLMNPTTPVADSAGMGTTATHPELEQTILFENRPNTLWGSDLPPVPETPRVRLIDTIDPTDKEDACKKFNIPVPNCANIRVNPVTGDAWIEMGGKPLPDLSALDRTTEALYRPLANIPLKLSDQASARKLRITPPARSQRYSRPDSEGGFTSFAH